MAISTNLTILHNEADANSKLIVGVCIGCEQMTCSKKQHSQRLFTGILKHKNMSSLFLPYNLYFTHALKSLLSQQKIIT